MTAVRIALGTVCLALLTSMGGAGIYAAPLTLPLLWLAAYGAGRGVRVFLDVVAVLTAAEASWAVGYSVGGPAEWLLPLAAAGAVAVLYPLSRRGRGAPRRQDVPLVG
jgi:hypothetical protein